MRQVVAYKSIKTMENYHGTVRPKGDGRLLEVQTVRL